MMFLLSKKEKIGSLLTVRIGGTSKEERERMGLRLMNATREQICVHVRLSCYPKPVAESAQIEQEITNKHMCVLQNKEAGKNTS